MRVAVVAEFYPRRSDPVMGIWAHRQTVASVRAGCDLEVFVLHRLLPPRETLGRLLQPRHAVLDGVRVNYVPYLSGRRGHRYAHWGERAARPLARALRRRGQFDLIHAHNAVPAGDAALRCGLPLIVSVHGGDVLWTVDRVPDGAAIVSRTLGSAARVLCNSQGIAERAQALGARSAGVLHLGTDVPSQPPARSATPLLCSVGHLVARKRHEDVIRALALLERDVRYLVIGDGPERDALGSLAAKLGVEVEFAGQLAPEEALPRSRAAWLFVMPSTEEAFGVAYVEAMAAGIPAIGCLGEPGPEEIAAAGGGIELIAPHDPQALAARIEELLADPVALAALGDDARACVAGNFTWERCGRATVTAYREVA